MMPLIATARIKTPVGVIELVANPQYLTSLRIISEDVDELITAAHPVITAAAEQIYGYFARTYRGFTIPLEPLSSPRGTILRAGINGVGYGETLTYGALARRIGSAPRAVGQACKRNAFPIIIPCHRITTNNGAENYSGGNGPATKAWLLDFEQGRTKLL